ncbi:MAG: NAD(P)/FAD-dependent oxidoreductase, partial [Cyanobium sp.]
MAPSCPAVLPERLPLLVAGGGPAGFMAAISAAEAGVGGVHLLEATPELLHKVRISGGGRCNVTHACWDPRELAGHYPRGSRALRGPFSRFAAGDALAWFADHGLELVEEADGRLFPRANRSSAVIDCLRRAAAAAGVQVLPSAALQAASPAAPGGFLLQVRFQAGQEPAACRQAVTIHAERLVLATGSHPSGRRLAASLGHTLVPPVPSLFTLALAGDPLLALAGVSMASVGLSLELANGCRHRQQGP